MYAFGEGMNTHIACDSFLSVAAIKNTDRKHRRGEKDLSKFQVTVHDGEEATAVEA